MKYHLKSFKIMNNMINQKMSNLLDELVDTIKGMTISEQEELNSRMQNILQQCRICKNKANKQHYNYNFSEDGDAFSTYYSDYYSQIYETFNGEALDKQNVKKSSLCLPYFCTNCKGKFCMDHLTLILSSPSLMDEENRNITNKNRWLVDNLDYYEYDNCSEYLFGAICEDCNKQIDMKCKICKKKLEHTNGRKKENITWQCDNCYDLICYDCGIDTFGLCDGFHDKVILCNNCGRCNNCNIILKREEVDRDNCCHCFKCCSEYKECKKCFDSLCEHCNENNLCQYYDE